MKDVFPAGHEIFAIASGDHAETLDAVAKDGESRSCDFHGEAVLTVFISRRAPGFKDKRVDVGRKAEHSDSKGVNPLFGMGCGDRHFAAPWRSRKVLGRYKFGILGRVKWLELGIQVLMSL